MQYPSRSQGRHTWCRRGRKHPRIGWGCGWALFCCTEGGGLPISQRILGALWSGKAKQIPQMIAIPSFRTHVTRQGVWGAVGSYQHFRDCSGSGGFAGSSSWSRWLGWDGRVRRKDALYAGRCVCWCPGCFSWLWWPRVWERAWMSYKVFIHQWRQQLSCVLQCLYLRYGGVLL